MTQPRAMAHWLPRAGLVLGLAALAVPAGAADLDRDRRERGRIQPASLSVAPAATPIQDRFVLATHERTLAMLDEKSSRQAEAIVQREYTRMRERRADLVQLEADAQEAMKLDDRYPGAHFLVGYVRYEEGRQARGRRDPATEEAKMQASHESYSQAIGLLQKQDDRFGELPVYYLYRINSAIHLAHLVPQVPRRAELLEEAVQDGRDVLKLQPKYAEQAHTAIGIASERLAWLVEGYADRYGGAVRAYESARKENPRSVQYVIALGRCKYQAAEAARYQPRRAEADGLEEAETQLRAVLKGDGFERGPAPEQLAEARYWLARVEFLRERYADAERACRAVLEAMPASADWQPLALETAADAALRQAEGRDATDEARAKHLQFARDCARQLAAANPVEAARVRGQALALEGKPREALTEFDRALPRPGAKRPLTLPELRLSQTRFELLLDRRWRPIFRRLRLPGTELRTVAREAEAAAATAEKYVALRGAAYYHAGLAALRVLPAEADEAARRKAVAHLLKAVRYSPTEDAVGRRSRQELQRQLDTLRRDEPEEE